MFFLCKSLDDVWVARGTVFHQIRPGAGFKTGDFVEEKMGGLPQNDTYLPCFAEMRLCHLACYIYQVPYTITGTRYATNRHACTRVLNAATCNPRTAALLTVAVHTIMVRAYALSACGWNQAPTPPEA